MYVQEPIGVNPEALGSRLPDFGLGVEGLASGSQGVVDGSRENCYSLFCTESMLESGMISRKREKFAKNVGLNSQN